MANITRTTVVKGTSLTLLLLVAGMLIGDRTGYGQSPGQVIQPPQCSPFQQTVVGVTGDFVRTIKVRPRTTVTLDQVAVRINAIDYIVPALAVLTTTVGSVSSNYYLPIPLALDAVVPARPLTLMEHVRLHADGGTDIVLNVIVDGRRPYGNGSAEWSVAGQSCPS